MKCAMELKMIAEQSAAFMRVREERAAQKAEEERIRKMKAYTIKWCETTLTYLLEKHALNNKTGDIRLSLWMENRYNGYWKKDDDLEIRYIQHSDKSDYIQEPYRLADFEPVSDWLYVPTLVEYLAQYCYKIKRSDYHYCASRKYKDGTRCGFDWVVTIDPECLK